MATRQYFRDLRTAGQMLESVGSRAYRDMNGTPGTAAKGTSNYSTATIPPVGPPETQYERIVWLSGSISAQIGWFTERFQDPTTLSGDIVFSVYATTALVSPNFVRLRLKLSKITDGGSYIEMPLGQADSATDLGTTVVPYTMTVTLPGPVAVSRNERLMVRMFMFLSAGSWPSTSTANPFRYDGPASNAMSYMELPGTIAFRPNLSQVSLRRTTTIGIGTFMDALPTFGVSAKTSAVVNTTASGTEIQWTKTAGGAVAEWITPRFTEQWGYPMLGANMYALESATAANVTLLGRVFRRRPNGTETLLHEENYLTELTTSEALYQLGVEGSGFAITWNIRNEATVFFAEDDRLVFRVYAVPAQGLTMGGSRTATISYDGPAATAGSSYLELQGAPDFKAETDPPAKPVPSGTSTMGWGNGQ